MRTTHSVEKALCHFIVLCLLLNKDYKMDTNILTQELCAPRDKVIRFAHIVYAQCKRTKEYLQLCLPSKVPALVSSNRRKK